MFIEICTRTRMYGFIGGFWGLIANFGFSTTFSDLFRFLCSSSCVFGDLHRLLDILLLLSPQHAIIGMVISSVEGNKEASSADALEGGTKGIGEPEVTVTPRGNNKNNINLLDTGIAQWRRTWYNLIEMDCLKN